MAHLEKTVCIGQHVMLLCLPMRHFSRSEFPIVEFALLLIKQRATLI